MKPLLFVVALLLSPLAFAATNAPPTERQKQLLEEILRILPKSEPWERWVKATGSYPPDFDTMTNQPFLPDPLRLANGREVKKSDWPRRRQELLAQFQYWVTGSWPVSPGNTRVADIRTRQEGGSTVQDVVLEFGPKSAAKLNLELIIPKGDGPFPVFMTQDTHRRWALLAVSRGYIGCVYAGADSRDDTDAWKAVWPESDWTKLTRRAWAASRCVDYLHTLPFVNTNQIALTGHSRNGKTALIAAAFDPRINATPVPQRWQKESDPSAGRRKTRVFFRVSLRTFHGARWRADFPRRRLSHGLHPKPGKYACAGAPSIRKLPPAVP